MELTNVNQENEIIRTPETVIAEIRATINHVQQTAIIGSIAIGNNFKELKELVPHGQWLEYIQENLQQFNERKVQRFIQIADTYGDKNSAYFRLISNPTISTDLSFSKALSLLSIDENEVENFAEKNDINDMTVKELEEKIKALKEENNELKEQHEKEIEELQNELRDTHDDYAGVNAQIEKLNKEIEQAKEENERLISEGSENTGDNSAALEELEKQLQEKLNELEDISKQKEEFEQKISELEKQQEENEAKKEAEIKAAVSKAKEQALQEAKEELQNLIDDAIKEKEEAIEQKELAEKKLVNSTNERLLKFKIKADELQTTFNEILEIISEQNNHDEEKAFILKNAVKKVIEVMEEQL